MATLILQALGASLGGLFGATGAIIGQAAGALVGNVFDNALLAPRRTITGNRLSNAVPFSADDGSALPRVHGTVRIPGVMIWATRFEEETNTERTGGKALGGGTRVTSYSYFANVAFALCEGPIAGVRRVWADGQELDLTECTMRVHTGTDVQAPDPLILAKQGTGNAPAYRGTAYVVFERLALGQFGNRVPQLQFEVMRAVGRLEKHLKAVCVIPGSTEFAYEPGRVTQQIARGKTENVNRHVLFAGSDWDASIDELQALCPSLEHVALVVAWFGNDLRAGECKLRPGVVSAAAPGLSRTWRCGGLTRESAHLVSAPGGAAAYGGTPDDASVLHAIADLKARGLKVTLYPFIMMDVPPGNTLPSPSGGTGQPAYPWRGRITCHPAEGVAGSPYGSGQAAAQINAFLGQALPQHFGGTGETITFTGSADDWGYRRMVLHYAQLAQRAGGVDAFLIGSELIGLTGVRATGTTFPFVTGLMQLATDVRQILGAQAKITYAADWTEYSGHRPVNAPGDLIYNLDALWMHPDIDAVGIDWYLPVTDWRDDDVAGGHPDQMDGPHDFAAFRRGVTGGEGHDWFYASIADRKARIRTPISDGAYNKAWVWRFKDIRSWWENPHRNRINGVEQSANTAWTPRAKPVWLTEIGCPAIDKGANQPNVFADPKSSENARPHFSDGGRDDLVQRLYLEAHQQAFDPAVPGFNADANPATGPGGSRMLDPSRCYVWAWDARPYPAFPLRRDAWGDGGNWLTGHWLNGRLGTASVQDLITAVAAEHKVALRPTRSVSGHVAGHAVMKPQSVRETLEPVLDLFGIMWRQDRGVVDVASVNRQTRAPVVVSHLVQNDENGAVTLTRAARATLPTEVTMAFADPMNGYGAATARAFQADGDAVRHAALSLPVAMDETTAVRALRGWLARSREEAAGARFAMAHRHAALQPGDLCALPEIDGVWRIERLTHGRTIEVEARRIARPDAASEAEPLLPPGYGGVPRVATGMADALLIDLPPLADDPVSPSIHVAATAIPWARQAVVERRNGTDRLAGLLQFRATTGETLTSLPPRPAGRRVNQSLRVRLDAGALQSVTDQQLLAGANLCALRAASGAWELLQFQSAEEIAPDEWLVSGLLRGQRGTDEAAPAGIPLGSAFVLLDQAVQPFGLSGAWTDPVTLALGPASKPVADPSWHEEAHGAPLRAVLPPAPVHVRHARRSDGAIAFRWIRRGRIDADDFDAVDIPLAEPFERYRIQIKTVGGQLLRQVTVSMPEWVYPQATRTTDLGSANAGFSLSLCQEGRVPGVGRWTTVLVPTV